MNQWRQSEGSVESMASFSRDHSMNRLSIARFPMVCCIKHTHISFISFSTSPQLPSLFASLLRQIPSKLIQKRIHALRGHRRGPNSLHRGSFSRRRLQNHRSLHRAPTREVQMAQIPFSRQSPLRRPLDQRSERNRHERTRKPHLPGFPGFPSFSVFSVLFLHGPDGSVRQRIDLPRGNPGREVGGKHGPQIRGRLGLQRGREGQQGDGGAALRVEDGLVAEGEDGAGEAVLVVRGDVRHAAEIGEDPRGGAAATDGLVGADDADAAERGEIIAAGENAEISEHVVRPVAEVELRAEREPGHVDLLADAFVELEQDAATAVDERVAVFCDDQVDVVVAEEKAQLCVALVGRDQELDVALFQLGDEGRIEVGRNLEGSVEVVAGLVDLPFTLLLLGNFHVSLTSSRDHLSRTHPYSRRLSFVLSLIGKSAPSNTT